MKIPFEMTTRRWSEFHWEIVSYFGVYIAYLLYGVHLLYKVRDAILANAKFEFAEGFAFGSKRDDSNDELENFNTFVRNWWMWYAIHAIVSLCLASWRRPQLGHAIVCLLALISMVHLLFVGILLCQLLSYYAVAQRPSKLLTWTLSAVWMIVINMIKNSDMWFTTLGYTEYFTLIITLSWTLLRCCSFVLSKANETEANLQRVEEMYSAEKFFGYTLYFPCMVYGPFLSYKRYIDASHRQVTKAGMRSKLFSLIFELLRVAFWWFVLQLALHYLYIHYMARDIAAVKLVAAATPTFGQHAIGYFMGQFFFLYYIVTYGVGIAFANFDELRPPHRPRCIGCIHSYSDMWKYFDEGLYEFLFRHIYAEICRKDSHLALKLLATAATFAFVFVWHGCYTYVLIWSALNFGCLIVEKSFKGFVASALYRRWTLKYLSEGNAQRLYAFLATQIFIPAAFSNVYFISGMDVGNFLMRGAYCSGIWNYLALTFCSYCFFQCSEVLLNFRKFRENTKLKS